MENEDNGPSFPGPLELPTGDADPVEGPGSRPHTSDTMTASERSNRAELPESSPLTEFSDFLPDGGGAASRPGQFASAQLQDETLKHAWAHVLAHEGRAQESVSHLTHPHFSTRGGLLYRVVNTGGGGLGTISGSTRLCE